MEKASKSFKNLPMQQKILAIILGTITVYLFIASEFQLPPANYVIRQYCAFFDTEEYYPKIIALIMLFPFAIVAGLIARRYEASTGNG